ncbi:FtsX-like permease family protein [Deltaproteobacteria bacterium TL4]
MRWRLLWKSLVVRKKQVGLALSAVWIGSAIITALAGVYWDISLKMRQELRAYGANLFVASKKQSEHRTLDPFTTDSIIQGLSGKTVAGYSGYLYGMARLDLGEALLVGVQFENLRKLVPYWQVEGRWVSLDFDERSCMVGYSLAQTMEMKVGSLITVMNRATGFHQPLKIKGIVETGGQEDQQLFVNLSLAQKILGLPGQIHHLQFSIVSDGHALDQQLEPLRQRFPQVDFKPLRQLSYAEGKILDKMKGLMALIALLIVSITALSLMTTLMTMTMQRSREIGLMKALGAENRQILGQFLAEMSVITGIGVLCGILFGFVLAQMIGQSVFNAFISLRPVVIPLTFGISLLTALVASVIPVRMMVHILPEQVLKGE